jgi:chitinase
MLWSEVRALQQAGIKVLGMLGEAHTGSFTALDGDEASFKAYYGPLRQMVSVTGLDGLDLDIEEDMSLAGIIRLMDRLKADFSNAFLIMLAPVATALQDKKHLSGFSYKRLEMAYGSCVAWYNTQFYCG